MQKFPREPPHILHNHTGIQKDDSQPVAKGGFPNYFGMQRFGTGHEPSSVMGRALLQGQVKELAMMALGARARHGKSLEAKWWGPQSEGGGRKLVGGWLDVVIFSGGGYILLNKLRPRSLHQRV